MSNAASRYAELEAQAKALFAESKRHFAAGAPAAAIAACERAAALLPQWGRVHLELGNVLAHHHDFWLNPDLHGRLVANGQMDAAMASWQRCIDTGWTSDWLHLNYGHALTLRGDTVAAARHLRRGIELKTRFDRPDYVQKHWVDGAVKGPDFIMIGATKCGTTSLYEYLAQHPQVLPILWKEPEYFRFPQFGVEWYLSHFPRVPNFGPRFVTGEASTCYMSIWDAKTRVKEQFPDVKLIALVRDPVDKTISHFHHDRKIGCEARSYEEALTRELDILEALPHPFRDADEYWKTEKGYVWLSLYVYFLENWLTAFPKERLLVIPSEDLYAQPAEVTSRVFEFLDLPEHRSGKYEVFLKGEYEKKQDDPIRERLVRFFAPHNERLEAMLGRKLDWQRP